MENTNGYTSTASRMESADSSREADVVPVFRDAIEFAEACIERAISQLTYGRRQEAEGAIELLKDAQKGFLAYRLAAREGQQGSEGMDG